SVKNGQKKISSFGCVLIHSKFTIQTSRTHNITISRPRVGRRQSDAAKPPVTVYDLYPRTSTLRRGFGNATQLLARLPDETGTRVSIPTIHNQLLHPESGRIQWAQDHATCTKSNCLQSCSLISVISIAG
uniref:Uncharacterized protein n=1 Tax=Oryzias latipes TaxID=8090 RepID=A0A3P9L9Y6_ORYLA